MGYQVGTDGAILDSRNNCISHVGGRRAILSDLSPVATSIASNYADFSSLVTFTDEALKLVSQVEKELAWLYTGVSGGHVGVGDPQTQNKTGPRHGYYQDTQYFGKNTFHFAAGGASRQKPRYCA